jgi:hypothetical protein
MIRITITIIMITTIIIITITIAIIMITIIITTIIIIIKDSNIYLYGQPGDICMVKLNSCSNHNLKQLLESQPETAAQTTT